MKCIKCDLFRFLFVQINEEGKMITTEAIFLAGKTLMNFASHILGKQVNTSITVFIVIVVRLEESNITKIATNSETWPGFEPGLFTVSKP